MSPSFRGRARKDQSWRPPAGWLTQTGRTSSGLLPGLIRIWPSTAKCLPSCSTFARVLGFPPWALARPVLGPRGPPRSHHSSARPGRRERPDSRQTRSWSRSLLPLEQDRSRPGRVPRRERGGHRLCPPWPPRSRRVWSDRRDGLLGQDKGSPLLPRPWRMLRSPGLGLPGPPCRREARAAGCRRPPEWPDARQAIRPLLQRT